MTPEEKYAEPYDEGHGPQCQSTAYLRLKGEDVATLRCLGWDGHPDEHFVTLEWIDDETIDWPEAHDPDEGFDVEVDALPHDEAIDAVIESESVGDDLVVEHSHEAIDETLRERVEGIRDAIAERERVDLQRRYGDGPTHRPRQTCGVAIYEGGPGIGPAILCTLIEGHFGHHGA